MFSNPILAKCCSSSPCCHILTTPLTHCHWSLAIFKLKAGQGVGEGGRAVLAKTPRSNPCIILCMARVKDHLSPCCVERIPIFKIQDSPANWLCQSNLQASGLIVSWQLSHQMCSDTTKISVWAVVCCVPLSIHPLHRTARSASTLWSQRRARTSLCTLSLATKTWQTKIYSDLPNAITSYGATGGGLLPEAALTSHFKKLFC